MDGCFALNASFPHDGERSSLLVGYSHQHQSQHLNHAYHLPFSSSFLTSHLTIAFPVSNSSLRRASAPTHRLAVRPFRSGASLRQRWSPLPARGRLGPLSRRTLLHSAPPCLSATPRERLRSLGLQRGRHLRTRLGLFPIVLPAPPSPPPVGCCCTCCCTSQFLSRNTLTRM